jgi:hypothetical protein
VREMGAIANFLDRRDPGSSCRAPHPRLVASAAAPPISVMNCRASIGVEVTAHFERIELRVGQRDRKAVHAALGTLSMRPDPLGGGGTCFCRVHETCFSVQPVTP